MSDLREIVERPVVTAISPQDEMYGGNLPHYFAVGLSGAYLLASVARARTAVLGDQHPIRDILDFGCGCGRVGRFIRSTFPEATHWVTDLRAADVAWCVENLGSRAVEGDALPAEAFDLIWLGSVFTHLGQASAVELLGSLYRALRPNGILCFSVQGRFAYERLRTLNWEEVRRHPWMSYHLDPPLVETILRGYAATGYGYVDYAGQTGYGVAVVDPRWYVERALSMPAATLVYFQERAFDAHQDVLAVMKRPVLQPRSFEFMVLAQHLINRSKAP